MKPIASPLRRSLLAVLCSLPLLSVQAQSLPLLKIATGELAPYATASRPDQGIALSIVKRAFELGGYQVEYTFMPWSRTLAETKLGIWDGTAYWGRKPEHAQSFLLSDNVLTEQWVFVYRQGIKFDWKDLNDLRPWRIALIQDYTYTPEIWAMAKQRTLKVDQVTDDVGALRMLMLDRVDVAPMERNVACDLLARHFSAADAQHLQTHPKWMTDSFTTHLMLPKSKPESEKRLQAFNEGLKKLRAGGEYAKLLAQVKCPVNWAK